MIFSSISSGLELEHLAGEYENRGFLKIMALGVPNAKSYAQPVTRLVIIKTNAETLHVKVLTFVIISGIPSRDSRSDESSEGSGENAEAKGEFDVFVAARERATK